MDSSGVIWLGAFGGYCNIPSPLYECIDHYPIACLWSDVSTASNSHPEGEVFFRHSQFAANSTDWHNLLSNFTNLGHSLDTKSKNLTLFIVTWYNVTYLFGGPNTAVSVYFVNECISISNSIFSDEQFSMRHCE